MSHKTRFLLEKLEKYKELLEKSASTRQINRVILQFADISTKFLSETKNKAVFVAILDALESFLSSKAKISNTTLHTIIDAMKSYHYSLESQGIYLDSRSSEKWIEILKLLIPHLSRKNNEHASRSLGLLILDSTSILPLRIIEFQREWNYLLTAFIQQLMTENVPRTKLYFFLDIIDRLNDLPAVTSQFEDLFTFWALLRVDHRVGRFLADNDAFEKLVITTSNFFQQEDILREKYGKRLVIKIQVLLLQLVFWGWHISTTTENFFSRLLQQLDYFCLIEKTLPANIKYAKHFDSRWTHHVQSEVISAIRRLIDLYESRGITQATEGLMDHFINEIFLKLSPAMFTKERNRSDILKMMEWLLKGSWSWKKAFETLWQLSQQSLKTNPLEVLDDILQLLERMNEQPFQTITYKHGEFFNLKHEAVLSLLSAIIETPHLEQVKKITLIAQLLSRMNTIFNEDKDQIIKNVREWFASRNEFDDTTKVLTLMCS